MTEPDTEARAVLPLSAEEEADLRAYVEGRHPDRNDGWVMGNWRVGGVPSADLIRLLATIDAARGYRLAPEPAPDVEQCPDCHGTGWVTLNEGGPEPDERVCENEVHQSDISFLVWRLIQEYDATAGRRPPSFVTMELLRNASRSPDRREGSGSISTAHAFDDNAGGPP